MKNYFLRLSTIKKTTTIIPPREKFIIAPSGTHYKVYLSNRFAIRFRDDNQKLLLREANLLKNLSHPLIPKVLWVGRANGYMAMVENRLPGEPLHKLWRYIPQNNQKKIIKQVIDFLEQLRGQTKNYYYSVSSNKTYDNFYNYLVNITKQKISEIKKFKQSAEILTPLLSLIQKSEAKSLFSDNEKIVIVHGDLIIHNLLTDGKNLTGVLDWELALFGDPDYDIFRLFYYQECAKAYQEQGTDDTFEADYMDKLRRAIIKSNLIKDEDLFQKKYEVVRAVFYLNALYWAVKSINPEKNLNEIITLWNKKSVVK